jgi:uncharacterized membrane protein YfcA
METWVIVVIFIAVAVSFTVSASAGLGGSLILVPTLALVLGTKEGVALAALLLAANNVVKVFAYRETLPFRKALAVIVLVALGAALGAGLLVAAPERLVTVAVIAGFVIALVAERLDLSRLRRAGGPVLAFGSGATSGFSGTSGPLKGMAIRQLNVDRAHFVGAASLASWWGTPPRPRCSPRPSWWAGRVFSSSWPRSPSCSSPPSPGDGSTGPSASTATAFSSGG